MQNEPSKRTVPQWVIIISELLGPDYQPNLDQFSPNYSGYYSDTSMRWTHKKGFILGIETDAYGHKNFYHCFTSAPRHADNYPASWRDFGVKITSVANIHQSKPAHTVVKELRRRLLDEAEKSVDSVNAKIQVRRDTILRQEEEKNRVLNYWPDGSCGYAWEHDRTNEDDKYPIYYRLEQRGDDWKLELSHLTPIQTMVLCDIVKAWGRDGSH